MPTTLPHRRCVHSIQYICLNSSTVIRGFSSLNSGDDLYSANSESHFSAVVGGKDPVTGRHSVILRLCWCQSSHCGPDEHTPYPDSVSRVKPPKITRPKTLAALPNNQYATPFLLVCGKYELRRVDSSADLLSLNALLRFPMGDIA